jgi:hypothetical protein
MWQFDLSINFLSLFVCEVVIILTHASCFVVPPLKGITATLLPFSRYTTLFVRSNCYARRSDENTHSRPAERFCSTYYYIIFFITF